MTLIIGCISPDFGIIAGDTQLSSGDINRGEIERYTKIKLCSASQTFMFGTLGKFSKHVNERNGDVTLYDVGNVLFKKIAAGQVVNKREYLNKFINDHQDIDATTIYIEKNDNGLILNSVSATDEYENDNHEVISILTLKNVEFMYNEPFFYGQNNYVNSILNRIKDNQDLTDSLTDSLFLVNNAILEIILSGEKVWIVNNQGMKDMLTNTVGGYVTIKVMDNNHDITYNLMHSYSYDSNSLLDRFSNPFSRVADNNSEVKYIDNLAMMVKNINVLQNQNIRDSLISLVDKQIKYIYSKEILNTNLLNGIINLINNIYNQQFEPFEIDNSDNYTANELEIDLPSDNHPPIDFDFLKRFFL